MPRKRPPIDEDPSENTGLGPDPTKTPAGKALPKPHYVPTNKGGRPAYDHAALTIYREMPIVRQGDVLRKQWSAIAKILADKIEKAAPSLTKKDWYYFKSLLVSGSTAYDKAFPKQDLPPVGNLVFNMFGSLGNDAIQRVLGTKQMPIIDVTPVEVVDAPQEATQVQQEVPDGA